MAKIANYFSASSANFRLLQVRQTAAGVTRMTSGLPLIRLSSINPFLLELRRRGADAASLLRELGLPTDIPASQELFGEPNAIYAFVERSATIADDSFLGYTIGSGLNLIDWDPISLATESATTVGELLTQFVINASDHSSATKYYLRTEGDQSNFGFERVVKPALLPGQNDAFYLGLLSRMLMHATHDRWDASRVLFRVADPDCIPGAGKELRVAKGDRDGIRMTFPSLWLFEPFRPANFRVYSKSQAQGCMPDSLLGSIGTALRPHLHETDLRAGKAAKICGYDRRCLSKELRDAGTTLSNEIAKLRAARAEQELTHSDRSIADIGQSVGFTDPTVFSRAFKNWTGQSPRYYRKTHR
jgi:AraC-like DNA-binding protein